MTARSLGPEGSQAGSSQLALEVAGLSLNERGSGVHGANERPRAMAPVTAAGLETMPAREIYNALEGTGSENSLFLALVQSLERAEARSRSTTSSFQSAAEVGVGVHSGTEGLSGPPNLVRRGEVPGGWQVGSCLGPTANLRMGFKEVQASQVPQVLPERPFLGRWSFPCNIHAWSQLRIPAPWIWEPCMQR